MAFSKKSTNESGAPDSSADPAIFLDFDGPGQSTKAERLARWLVLAIALALGAWLMWALAASFLPRWWAQHVGDRVDGSFSAGVGWGFGYGFFATALSILILVQARRKFLPWWGKIVVVFVALAVSAPSFMTLAVTIGTGKAAHAGRRIFDVNAPAFQWATLIGVVTAAVLVIGLMLALWRARMNRQQVTDLRKQVEASQTAPAESEVDAPE